MSVNWKTLAESEIDTLKSNSSAYLHAIYCFNKWDLLFEQFSDDDHRPGVLGVLKKRKTGKTLLKGLTAEKIIELLDSSVDAIRLRLLKILVMRCDEFEVVPTVGKTVLTQIKNHPWASHFLPFIYCIQPLDDLRTVLTGRVKEKCMRKGVTPDVWNMFLDPENHFSKKDYLKLKFRALNISEFGDVELLAYRKSLCNLIIDVACEALVEFKEKTKGYEHFVLAPAMTNVMALKHVWRRSKELRSKIRDAILASNGPLLQEAYRMLLIDSGMGQNGLYGPTFAPFPLDLFLRNKLVSPSDVLEHLLPKVFQPEMENQPDHPKVLEMLCKRAVVYGSGSGFPMFVNLLKQLSERKEHPLSEVWPYIIKKMTEFIEEDIIEHGREGLIQNFCNCHLQLQVNRYMWQRRLLFSHDEAMAIVTNAIQHVFDRKDEIVKDSPEKYTEALNCVIRTLTRVEWRDDERSYERSFGSAFFHFPMEFRDKIVMEAMADPLGQKLLNGELSKKPPSVPLSFALLIGDLKRMTIAIAGKKAEACDEYGFQDKVSYSFPHLLTQEEQSSAHCEGKVHIFERYLYQSFRHSSMAAKTFNLYQCLVFKVLRIAQHIDKEYLYEQAADMHWRFCRFAISKVTSRAQALALNLFTATVCHPLAIYAYVKAGKDVSELICKQLLANAPFVHPRCPMLLISVLSSVLATSYSPQLPGIDQAMGKIAETLINRAFVELPSNRNAPGTSGAQHSWSVELASDKVPEVSKMICNAQAQIKWPEGYLKKVSKRMFLRMQEDVKGEFAPPSVFSQDVMKSILPPNLFPGVAPFMAVLKFVKQKVDQYEPKHFIHPSTNFVRDMIATLNRVVTSAAHCYQPTGDIPDGYERTHTCAQYDELCRQLTVRGLVLRRETADVVKSICPEDHFYTRLLTEGGDTTDDVFALLDAVLPFKPLTVEQARDLEGKPKPKLALVVNVTVDAVLNASNLIRIHSVVDKPKPKRYNKFGVKLPDKPEKAKKFVYEPQLHTLFSEYLAQYTRCVPSSVCEHMRLEGPSLVANIVDMHNHLHSGCESEDMMKHLVAVLDLLINDLLIKNPKPTPEDPKPKETPTLFCDEEGVVRGSVPPISKRFRLNGSSLYDGLPKFKNTTALLAYVGHMIYEIAEWGTIDLTKFAPDIVRSVKKLVSVRPNELKKIVGDLNENHWVDYFIAGILSVVDFGDTLKAPEWAKQDGLEVYHMVLSLLSCTQFHTITLECLNQKLLGMNSYAARTGLLSGLISGLSSLNLAFTLETRIATVTLSMDPKYVGYPLPQFSIDYALKLSKEPKLAAEVTRAIAAAAVSYMKNQSIRDMEPAQVDAMFEILTNVHKHGRAVMIPTFCQLLRPKFCRSLVYESPVYSELMPRASEPRNLIPPQDFQELSMPKKGPWHAYYERFLSSFVGSSLLSNDEHAVELAIHVLTKIGIRGGEASGHIAPFVTKACKDFNPLQPSKVLINFVFRFCVVSEHQNHNGMLESFVGMFRELRTQLDIVNQKQLKAMWLREDSFSMSSYDPLRNVFSLFIDCLSDVTLKSKEPSDISLLHSLCKQILPMLDGDKPPVIQFSPFLSLRRTVTVLANDSFANALATETGEGAMEHLLAFTTDFADESSLWSSLPGFVETIFHKNEKSLTKKLVLSFANWPTSLATQETVHTLLRPAIDSFLETIKQDENELQQVLPLLSKLTTVGFPQPRPVPFMAKNAGGMAPQMRGAVQYGAPMAMACKAAPVQLHCDCAPPPPAAPPMACRIPDLVRQGAFCLGRSKAEECVVEDDGLDCMEFTAECLECCEDSVPVECNDEMPERDFSASPPASDDEFCGLDLSD